MNIQVTVREERETRVVRLPTRHDKGDCRTHLLHEVVAGLLWMALDVPDDACREEVEELARQLVTRIKAGWAEPAIEAYLTMFCQDRFCCRVSASNVRCLLVRAACVVRAM